jgi:purine-cytosine permease-like protein
VADEQGGPRHRPHEEFAHDLREIEDDLAYEREVLQESIVHDYSTSETGIVPMNRRRPLWHIAGLWTTFAAGFSFLFVGTEVHDAGFSLPGAIGVAALGIGIYNAYALFGAYLGSRTGQTHALLTRSIFGITGSYIVSALLVIGPIGWVGFQGGLMVQIWNGLYGWSAVETLTIVFAAVMIFNNLFGFTGISVFARYVVTPLIMLWVIYLVLKGVITDSSMLGDHPKNTSGFTLWQIVGVVIGFALWGNEPDIFRYGKPKFLWPAPAFGFALVFGFILFTVGGWMMADFANTTDFGPIVKYTTNYSLFGWAWLAFILASLSQFAINDGNYYEAINGIQNIFGGWSKWRRVYSCLICAGFGALAGWLVNYEITNGFFKVAAFLAITVPCATVIMCVDHFLLPRLFSISRPLTDVPRWGETGIGNVPAIVALGISVLFGAYATGIIPGEDANRYWGPAPLLAWVLSGLLYVVAVAVARAVVPAGAPLKRVLGYSQSALAADVPGDAILDIATIAEAADLRQTPVPAPSGA